MIFISNYILDFGSSSRNKMYYNLLINEDFDFKTKDIKIDFSFKNDKIFVKFKVDSIINLKIASNSLIKSLEIIRKTELLI